MLILKKRFCEKTVSWLCLACLTICILALHLFVLDRQNFADDLYFATALDQRSLWEFLSFRYFNWTGRIPIEFALVLVSQHVWLWKMLNLLSLIVLAYSITALAHSSTSVTSPRLALVAFLILLTTPDVLLWSAWWLTGSVNYLWPTAAGALALSIYFNTKPPRAWRAIVAVFCGAFASFSEQVGILIFILVSVSICWRYRENTAQPWHYVFALVISLSLIVALTAPGNSNRFVAEQLRWFPDFANMGWVDKANIGLGLLAQNLMSSGNWLVLVVSLGGILAVVRPSISVVSLLSVLPGLLWLTGSHLALMVGYQPIWLSSLPLNEASVARPIAYVAMAMSVYAFSCLVWVTGFALNDQPNLRRLMLAFALIVGAGTLVLVGWSPTSSASGSRTALVFMMVMVVVAGDLLQRFRESANRFNCFLYYALCAAIVFGGLTRLYGLLFTEFR